MRTKHNLAVAVALLVPLTLGACGSGDGLTAQEYEQLSMALSRTCGLVNVTELAGCYRSTLETVRPMWQRSADSDIFKWLLVQDQHIADLVKAGRMRTPMARRFAMRAERTALRMEYVRVSSRDGTHCGQWSGRADLCGYTSDWATDARTKAEFSADLNAAASPPPAPANRTSTSDIQTPRP